MEYVAGGIGIVWLIVMVVMFVIAVVWTILPFLLLDRLKKMNDTMQEINQRMFELQKAQLSQLEFTETATRYARETRNALKEKVETT